MKILQVIDKLDVGGAERVFLDMTNLLHEENYDVNCLFLIEKGFLGNHLHPGVNYFELNRTKKFNLLKALQCASIIKKYDIVHCHMQHVYRYIRLVSTLFSIDKKILLHEHSGFIDRNYKIPFLFSSILRPSYYIGVCKNQIDWATNKLKLPSEIIYYLPNTIFLNDRLDAETKVLQSDLILVGNIKENKNQLFAVEISKHLNLSLNIIGKNQSINYCKKLKDKISNEKADVVIYQDIHIVQGVIPLSKIGLSTSICESGPLILIEYLSAGIPFLSYRTGEVSEILDKYFPEFFIDNFDLDQWCSRIELLLKINYKSEELRAVYNHCFSRETYFQRLGNIYSKICAS